VYQGQTRVGLAGSAGRRAGGLSLGQEKRLAIAGAIMGQPDLIVLDEPLSGLDPMGVRGMLALLQELTSDGQTLIVSSHRLHEMEEVLTHAAVILDGELVREAPLADYLGQRDTWIVRVKDDSKLKDAASEYGTLRPFETGTWALEAPGKEPDEIVAGLCASGAGVLHFAEARMGLQASFETLVDDRRRASSEGAA